MKTLSPYLMALVSVASTVSAGTPASGIQRVAWLQGCWEAASAERTVEEHWMAPRGDSMVGVSRTVRGRELAEYELVVIREQGDQLAYEAHPSGQPSATFVSHAVTDTAVVFQNLKHDFPKRIGYERGQKDRLRIGEPEGRQPSKLLREVERESGDRDNGVDLRLRP